MISYVKFLEELSKCPEIPRNLKGISAIGALAAEGVEPAQAKLVTPAAMATDAGSHSGFIFGLRSKKELLHVRPELAQVAHMALAVTTQDFMVFEGLRTLAEQKRLVELGQSQTLKSYHLAQPDGYSHAVDLVPVKLGLPKWDWELIYPVVLAVDEAATRLGYADKIVWGGAWDRRLSDFGGNPDSYRKAVRDYCERHPGRDFIDGPHYQWMD